jgi:hypothetical protein
MGSKARSIILQTLALSALFGGDGPHPIPLTMPVIREPWYRTHLPKQLRKGKSFTEINALRQEVYLASTT